MAEVVQPTNQQTHIDPYSSNLFDMGVEDTRVYLSRQINYLLELLGSDCAIRGLHPSYTIESNNITFTISTGRAIVDSTLHTFDDAVTLSIDSTSYDESGYFVIDIAYRYIQTLQSNKPFFKVSWVSSGNGLTQLPNSWSPARDRLVLCWFEIEKNTSGNLVSLQQHCSPYESIVIDNITYYPRRGTDLDSGWAAAFEDMQCFLPPISGGTFFDDESTYRCTISGGNF